MAFETFFESRGYGPDGVKLPSPDLHVVDPDQPSFVDELLAAGVVIFAEDLPILRSAAPIPTARAEATIRDYQMLLEGARMQLAIPQLPDESIMPGEWQQTA
jgi:hypothetical protein